MKRAVLLKGLNNMNYVSVGVETNYTMYYVLAGIALIGIVVLLVLKFKKK